jgi:hypothetical protein
MREKVRLVPMSIARFAAAPILALALLAPGAAVDAATYTWPLQITQPVSVTNLSFPAGSSLVVICTAFARNPGPVKVQGGYTLPLTPPASGALTYSGTIAVSINGASEGTAPQSGSVIECDLREKIAGVFTTIGSAQLPLP